ncbi:MAG: nickel insertion protein, partial [Candidatus Hodarchaeota archaeon]
MTENIVLLDVRNAGTSGDMFLSALVDFVGEDDALLPVVASLLIYDPTLRVRFVSKTDQGFTGIAIETTKDSAIRFSPSSLQEMVSAVCEELELSPKATQIALNALNEILQAESRAHETPIDKLHLHETGSVDTVLDLVGTAYLLERANLIENTRFISTHVAVGSGVINTEHGPLEVPVPAVAEILVVNEIPFVMGEPKTEVLTPTGAAILATLAKEWIETADDFIARQQGIGFGSRDLGDVPNLMRFLIGVFREDSETSPTVAKKDTKKVTPKKEPAVKDKKMEKKPEAPTEEKPSMIDSWTADDVIVIETNVDDIDGEVMGTL